MKSYYYFFCSMIILMGISFYQTVKAEDTRPKTLAIFPFENNSVTDPDRFTPLTKGLSAMLITDLNNSQDRLKVIERERLQAILKEIALSQSGTVDESTAIKAGKILGAQSIAFGAFMVMGEMVRMDLRIIKVETGELVMAESISGDTKGFLNLERELAKKIASSLGALGLEGSASTSRGGLSEKQPESKEKGISPALLYSKGLDALDRGDKVEAERLFKECVSIDPTYKSWVDDVKGLK